MRMTVLQVRQPEHLQPMRGVRMARGLVKAARRGEEQLFFDRAHVELNVHLLHHEGRLFAERNIWFSRVPAERSPTDFWNSIQSP